MNCAEKILQIYIEYVSTSDVRPSICHYAVVSLEAVSYTLMVRALFVSV